MAERVGDRGLVELWPAPEKPQKGRIESRGLDGCPSTRGREAAPETQLADRVAEADPRLARCRARSCTPRMENRSRAIDAGDVLILVRQRGAMFYEMQRALNREHLPVAGSDRMMLHDETAYQDLDALGRFCLLPADDLALAEVLKGPFIGLNDDDLLKIAPVRQSLAMARAWRCAGAAIRKGAELARTRT